MSPIFQTNLQRDMLLKSNNLQSIPWSPLTQALQTPPKLIPKAAPKQISLQAGPSLFGLEAQSLNFKDHKTLWQKLLAF